MKEITKTNKYHDKLTIIKHKNKLVFIMVVDGAGSDIEFSKEELNQIGIKW